MKKNFSRGFTLIELLVVIAIIGILSSVVLVSLNGARGKANATALRSTVASLRPAIAVCNGNSAALGTWGTAVGQPVCTGETAVIPAGTWGGATIGTISYTGTQGAYVMNFTPTGHTVAGCNLLWRVDEASSTVNGLAMDNASQTCK